jgi:enoyl-CoA hydratase
MIERHDQGGVTVLTMAHGKVNALDHELAGVLTATFANLPPEQAVVLTGQGSSFSAGVDLAPIVAGGPDYVARFFPALGTVVKTVFDHPGPVVAAINGHAMAGGAVLACACDRRLMAEGKGRIGLIELAVGVPFPLAALEIVRAAVGPTRAADLILSAAAHLPAAAFEWGLVDQVVPAEGLLDAARAEAERLAAIPPAAYAHTKRQLHRPVDERIAAHADADDGVAQAVWASDANLERLRAHLDSLARR